VAAAPRQVAPTASVPAPEPTPTASVPAPEPTPTRVPAPEPTPVAATPVVVSIEDAWFDTPHGVTQTEDHRAAARLAAGGGLYAEAATAWGEVLSLAPDDVEARLGRGSALQELGDFAAAAEDLAYAVTLAPAAFAPAQAIADLAFFRKDYEESIVRYDAALRIDPSHALALCRRGLARFHLRDWRNAAADLELARATDPTIPQIDTYIRLARQGIKER